MAKNKNTSEIGAVKGTTIIVKVQVKAKNPKKLPDWGLGPGILAQREMILKEDVTKENVRWFYKKRDEVYEELVNETLEAVYEVKKV